MNVRRVRFWWRSEFGQSLFEVPDCLFEFRDTAGASCDGCFEGLEGSVELLLCEFALPFVRHL